MGHKQGCVIKTSTTATKTTKKVMSHDAFMKRINKSLYFGQDLTEETESPLVVEVSKPLAEYASELFSDSHRGYSLNRLSTVEASSVQTATPATLIMALIYLDRLNVTDPGYSRRITPQELFIVSMMISTKFYEGHDEEIFLSDWAEYGNMSEGALKHLELNFLCAIEWDIYVSNEQFFEKLSSIEKTLARREGLRRGWLTYTELIQLLPPFTLAKFLLNNITIMAVSYAASVMTIASALFLAAHIPGTSLHRNRTQLTTNSSDILNEPDISVNETSQSITSSASMVNAMRQQQQHNETNLPFNAEDELLKLEQEYREEALRDSVLQKHHEISTEYRLTLPKQILMAKINVNQKCAKHGKHHKQQGHWFAHKEEYSDYGKLPLGDNKQNPDDFDLRQRQTVLQTRSDDDLTDFVCPSFEQSSRKSYDNTTMIALLWHYLTETVQQYKNFMNLPFLWLKFI